MEVSEILENYKKLCTRLCSADNLMPKDFQALNQLKFFCDNKSISDEKIKRAFKMANESDFLCGKKTSFKADIRWMCNPIHIDDILSGKYKDNKKPRKLDNNREYDFKELERNILEETKRNGERLRSDKEFRKSLEEWVVKYPNLKPVLED